MIFSGRGDIGFATISLILLRFSTVVRNLLYFTGTVGLCIDELRRGGGQTTMLASAGKRTGTRTVNRLVKGEGADHD